MVRVSASFDQADLGQLEAMLSRVASETPKRLASETRRAAIELCRSLRAQTKSAPKKIPKKEYAAEPSDKPPRYVHSNSADRALLHRWKLTRKLGTPDEYTRHHFVYTSAHRGKKGRMAGKNLAAERRELLKLHGGIPRHGLAKKSWGWVMKSIYSAMADLSFAYRPRKHERRDPRNAVNGKFEKFKNGASALIVNALDYIKDALKPNALNKAQEAAAKSLWHKISEHIDKLSK